MPICFIANLFILLHRHQKNFAMKTLPVQVNSSSVYRLSENLEAVTLFSIRNIPAL
jgi:hypothetical protein